MTSALKFDPAGVLGGKIEDMTDEELLSLASGICAAVIDRTGGSEYRGGIYPDNISVDANGSPALGPVSDGDVRPGEQEYLAPELLQSGRAGSAADVYSVGMLLYSAVAGGILPSEREAEDLPLPEGTDEKLAKVIRKATAYSSADRYGSVIRLKAALDACLNGEALPDESEEEFDHRKEIEITMAAILNDNDNNPEPELEAEVSSEEAVPEETAPEEGAELEEAAEDSEETTEETEETAEEAEEAEETAGEAEEAVEESEETTEESEEEASAEGEEVPAEEAAEEPKKEPVYILREEPNPELAPIVLEKPVPPLQYMHAAEREKKIAEKVRRRRRRPFIFILIVCVLLVIAALIYGSVTKDKDIQPFAPAETPVPSTIIKPVETPPVQETPQPTEPVVIEHTYQFLVEDVSWEEAAARCKEMGGYLVTINDEDEFNRIVSLAESADIKMVWVGGRRIDGAIQWESGETVEYYKWDFSEPSYRDTYDGAEEDCILLWYHNGWNYNDSRNDPISYYYDAYSGKIAYVCEFDS